MVVFLILSLTIPNHYSPWLSFYQESLAFIAFAPITLLLLLNKKNNPYWFSIIFLLIAIYAVIQFFIGIIKFHGDVIICTYYLLASAVVINAFSQAEIKISFWNFFWTAWLISGIICWGIMMHQWLQLDFFQLFIIDSRYGSRPYANLAQPNHVATLLWMSCASIYFFYYTKKINSTSCLLLLVVMAHGLALTQTRTVIVVFLFLLLLALLKIKNPENKGIFHSLFLLLSIYVFFCIVNPMFYKEFYFHEIESSLTREVHTHRLGFLLQAIYASMLKPWMGYGFGQISIAQMETILLITPTQESYTISFHNIIADIFTWIGFPLGMALSFLFFEKIIECVRCSKSKEDFSALIGISAISAHALLEFPLFYSYFLIPFLILISSICKEAKRPALKTLRLKNIFYVAAFFLLILFGIKIFAEYRIIEEKWRETSFKIAGFENKEKDNEYGFFLLNQLEALNKYREFSPVRNLTKENLDEIKSITERFPTDNNLLKYAFSAGINGDGEEAEKKLILLCKIFSKDICQSKINSWEDKKTNGWHELNNIKTPEFLIP